MSLHNRIREARNSKGITQTELAESLGVAKTTVAGWEKNREPTAAQIGAIADILDSSVSFLLQDEVSLRAKKEQPAEGGELSQVEVEFFNEFRKIPDSHKGLAASLCTALVRELVKHQTIEIKAEAAVPVGSNR